MNRDIGLFFGAAARQNRRLLVVAGMLLVGQSGVAFAQDGHSASHDAVRQASAHVHGEAQLNIAVDGQEVFAEFTAPAIDVVGFEHVARDAAEQNAVANAIEALKSPETLFVFSGSDCVLSRVDAASEGLLTADEAAEGHAEFEASYVFHCDTVDDLTMIDLGFFDIWPSLKEMEVVFLGVDTQLSLEMTPAFHQIDLK